MRIAPRLLSVGILLLAGPLQAGESRKPPPPWLPDEMPLPLAVHDGKDLDFKRVVEREYLVFNLLASGKIAYDAGRFSEAADHWETLLQLGNLDRDIDAAVRPLAIDARQKAGQPSKVAALPPPPPPVVEEEAPKAKPKKTNVDVHGTVAGGNGGAGGAVISLKRTDGKSPAPVPKGDYLMVQVKKEFVPHILAVPVGATVSFRNDDEIFHDVFTPSGFDLGLYKSGTSRTQTFEKPGATALYCNIHAHMNAWVVTVDTPYYAVADSNGRFTIRNVPPGTYKAEVWHEGATKTSSSTATIESGMGPLALSIGSDRHQAAYPLDKYGKPRQTQLGY